MSTGAGRTQQALQVAPAATDDDDVQSWDEYVAEATPNVELWRKRLPDGEILEVPCPTREQMDALGEAQARGDSAAMYVALFGVEMAPKLLTLTAGLPFTVSAKMVNDVMFHYATSV